jgi:branched-chain amino acid transport system permease protein
MTQVQKRQERLDRGIKVRSEGLYALMSWRELGYLLLPRLLLIGGLLLLPFLVPGLYWQRVVTIVCIYALLAISFDFLAHYVGLVSLGGAFFIGIGGYLSALANTGLGLPPPLSILAAGLAGGCICTLFLLPCLPLRGVYFAIVSLMYPLVFARIIEALDILGGTDGIMGIESFTSAWTEQYLALVLVLACVFALRRLMGADLGLLFQAVKDNDQAVRASGMSVSAIKALAVFIAASVGCVGGGCLVHIYMWAGISLFALDFSILPIAATVIGGGGTLVGPLIGCFILVPISELLRDFGTLRIVFYALILVAFVIFRSEGLFVFARRKYQQFEHWVEV